MSIVLQGSTSGSITLQEPAIAGSTVLSLPATSGTIITTASTGGVSQSMLASGVGGTGPAFSAFRNADQSISSNTWTKVQFNNEDFDTNSCFDTSTNRFTPNVAGYYQINFIWSNGSSSSYNYAALYKNGSLYKLSISDGSGGTGAGISIVMYFNGSTDYVEAYVYSNFGPIVGSSQQYNTFNGAMVRAA